MFADSIYFKRTKPCVGILCPWRDKKERFNEDAFIKSYAPRPFSALIFGQVRHKKIDVWFLAVYAHFVYNYIFLGGKWCVDGV